VFYEKYLDEEYGDWRAPPKDTEKWVWYEHGNWKKIYKKENLTV